MQQRVAPPLLGGGSELSQGAALSVRHHQQLTAQQRAAAAFNARQRALLSSGRLGGEAATLQQLGAQASPPLGDQQQFTRSFDSKRQKQERKHS